jgi:tetratricopeptide (TPR) repeat protein
MTTTIDTVAPAPSRSAAGSPVLRGRRPSVLPLLAKLIVAIGVVSLVAFNIWWYWRDTRELPDLATVTRWMSKEQYALAEPALREHLRRAPHDGGLMIMIARALAARGDILRCARQLHDVPSWWPQKAEARFREGQSYFQIDRAKDAEDAWLLLMKNDPLHPVPENIYHDACMALLNLYAIEDRWEDAYPLIWTAYDHAAGSEERQNWLTMRMRAELERISHKESITTLRRYVAAGAQDLEALRALARAEQTLGEIADSERHFRDCLKKRPDDVRAWHGCLALLLEQGELERFLALLSAAPPSADADPETWYFRGIASEKAGDWGAAASHFRKAIDLNPFLQKCHYRLGMADERLGLHEQAVVHRRRSTEMNETRGRFPAAYSAYFAARLPGEAATAARRLAAICETLGWARAAQAWGRLADEPE